MTRYGIIGTVDPKSGRIEHIKLPGKEIQNSFAVDEEAVYVISDYALYAMEATPTTGKPEIVWQEAYDRGRRVKPSMFNQGSGTTPTLFGEGYVAIADNADPQMNVLVYKRGKGVEGERLVCQAKGERMMRSHLVSRQGDGEGRPCSEAAVHGDRTAMQFDEGFGDGQPQA